MNAENKRLSINLVAQVVSFSVQFALNFLLTPYIIKKLGPESYGFVGLTESFVLYAQVLVLALNSMAGRFVTVAYHQNKIEEAKRLFSSVFYANAVVSLVIVAVCAGCVAYLEHLINIPSHLTLDVKLLFSLVFLNFVISILFSTFRVATFIKNRLELNAIRNIVSKLLRVIILVAAFGLFLPHLWYVGLSAVLCTLYIALWNIRYTKLLTPELKISLKLFDLSKVKLLVSSGVWNSITKLGNLLGQGLDLLLANLFISATAMSSLAVTKKIPVVVLSLVASICAAFAPSLTRKFAQNELNSLKMELLFSVKVAGAVALIPCCFIFTMSDKFYALWVPTMDSQQLYWISVFSMVSLPIALSLEGIQNIFTVANKVKVYSIVTFSINILCFLTLLIGISFVEDSVRIYFLSIVTSFWSFLRVFVFLPIYGAMCIHEKKTFLYPSVFRMLLALAISMACVLAFKQYLELNSWASLSLISLVLCGICGLSAFFIVFVKKDREKVSLFISKKLHRMGN